MKAMVTVTDRSGSERRIAAELGHSLMLALVENDYEIEATCGGVANCGTCHVYIDSGPALCLPDMQLDEDDVLAVSRYRRPNSRLSCQIQLSETLNGLHVRIAPSE